MVTVKIGIDERKLEQADASWINQEISHRRRDGRAVCVSVTITEPDLNVALVTPGCQGGGGGGRPPNPREAEVLELWTRHHLNDSGFTGGNVESFLKQLRRMLD